MADLVVFDPDTVQPVTEDVVHDFPNNGWWMRELAAVSRGGWQQPASDFREWRFYVSYALN